MGKRPQIKKFFKIKIKNLELEIYGIEHQNFEGHSTPRKNKES